MQPGEDLEELGLVDGVGGADDVDVGVVHELDHGLVHRPEVAQDVQTGGVVEGEDADVLPGLAVCAGGDTGQIVLEIRIVGLRKGKPEDIDLIEGAQGLQEIGRAVVVAGSLVKVIRGLPHFDMIADAEDGAAVVQGAVDIDGIAYGNAQRVPDTHEVRVIEGIYLRLGAGGAEGPEQPRRRGILPGMVQVDGGKIGLNALYQAVIVLLVTADAILAPLPLVQPAEDLVHDTADGEEHVTLGGHLIEEALVLLGRVDPSKLREDLLQVVPGIDVLAPKDESPEGMEILPLMHEGEAALPHRIVVCDEVLISRLVPEVQVEAVADDKQALRLSTRQFFVYCIHFVKFSVIIMQMPGRSRAWSYGSWKADVQDDGPVVADAGDAVAVGDHAVGDRSEAVDEEVVDGAVTLGLGEVGEGVGFGHAEQRARGLHLQSSGLDAPQPRIPVTAGQVAAGELRIYLTHSAFDDFPLPAGMDVYDADPLHGAGLPEHREGVLRGRHRVAHEDRVADADADAPVPFGYVARHRRQHLLQADDVGIDILDHPGHRLHPPAPVVLPRLVPVAGPLADVERQEAQGARGGGGGSNGPAGLGCRARPRPSYRSRKRDLPDARRTIIRACRAKHYSHDECQWKPHFRFP